LIRYVVVAKFIGKPADVAIATSAC